MTKVKQAARKGKPKPETPERMNPATGTLETLPDEVISKTDPKAVLSNDSPQVRDCVFRLVERFNQRSITRLEVDIQSSGFLIWTDCPTAPEPVRVGTAIEVESFFSGVVWAEANRWGGAVIKGRPDRGFRVCEADPEMPGYGGALARFATRNNAKAFAAGMERGF